MVKATIYKRKDGSWFGLKMSGHAGYAAHGSDIICAGVSALVLNTINSLEALTDSDIELKTNEHAGLVAFKFKQHPGEDAELLMNSLILGLQGIRQENDNKEYIKIIFKEV